MNPILLDTHTLVWQLEDYPQLGRQAARLFDAAARDGIQLVSAMTFWEVAMLAQPRRLALSLPSAIWRQRALELGIVEIPVSGEIGIVAAELEDFPPDPADRIIAATAMAQGARWSPRIPASWDGEGN